MFGEDFERIWGESWEDSASFVEGLWKDLEKILKKIVDGVRPFFEYFLNWDPRAASLRPAKHHNSRGFPNPYACWILH